MGLEMFCTDKIDVERDAGVAVRGNKPANWLPIHTATSCRVFNMDAAEIAQWDGRPEQVHYSVLIPSDTIDVSHSDRILFPASSVATSSNPSVILEILGVLRTRPRFTTVSCREWRGDMAGSTP